MSVITRPALTWTDMHGRFDAHAEITFRVAPTDAERFELRVMGSGLDKPLHIVSNENHGAIRDGLPPGSYRAWARCAPWADGELDGWSPWSFDRRFTCHSPHDRSNRDRLRRQDRTLALICDRDASGVVTLLDPWGTPPNCESVSSPRWFPTACYEGRTALFNESPEYYRDPLEYLSLCLREARSRGFEFITWNDLLDGKSPPKGIILQFDVDGGPRSMDRVGCALRSEGIRATVMTHLRALGWYEYDLDPEHVSKLRSLEAEGWAVGYHNNALGLEQHLRDATGVYDTEMLERAAARFTHDVSSLREWFDIRTYTHHGGNVLNLRTPPPPDRLGVVGVDKPVNPGLWQKIRSQFSDGGMLVRPVPLREHLANLGPGIHFIRCHPFKYANYVPPFDAPPLADGAEFAKQMRWLDERDRLRMGSPMVHRNRSWPLSGTGKVDARYRPDFFFPWLVDRHFDAGCDIRLCGEIGEQEIAWLRARGHSPELASIPGGDVPDGLDGASGVSAGNPAILIRAIADTDPLRGAMWNAEGESWTPESLESRLVQQWNDVRIECLGHRIYALVR